MTKEIIRDIEVWGECFIGTMEAQGMTAYRRYMKVKREFEKVHPGSVLAWDSESGICWWVE